MSKSNRKHSGDKYWITQSGEEILISDLGARHLENIVKMIQRKQEKGRKIGAREINILAEKDARAEDEEILAKLNAPAMPGTNNKNKMLRYASEAF